MRFRNYDNLRSFIVVARYLNMGQAADELNLTKGAVSYQVQQLEGELGFQVFSRSRRNLALTEQGARLLLVARNLFENVEHEVEDLRRHSSARINIGMATYFASRWLSPRLMRFITQHPEIALRIQPLIDVMDLRSNELDLVVRWGKGQWKQEGLVVELIFACPAMLTCSPATGALIESEGIEAVVKRMTLLHDRDRSDAWRDWFRAAAIEWSPAADPLVIPDPNVRVQAVIDGQGIALYDDLVDDELAAGRLYQYRSVSLDSYGYYLVYPKNCQADSASSVFRRWIMQEAVDSARS